MAAKGRKTEALLIVAQNKSSENKTKHKDRLILGPCQRTKKAMKYVVDSDTNCS